MPGMTFDPIGTIHTPFAEPSGTPIQPAGARDVPGTVVIRPEYAPALDGVDGFSHLWLLWHSHHAGPARLTVTPFLDDHPRGLFATRAPARPNAIGLSLVRLARIDGLTLHVLDVDIVDGTPLLDLKPYLPAFDTPTGDVSTGWLADRLDGLPAMRDDGRFTGDDSHSVS